jgi:hypothetical protein
MGRPGDLTLSAFFAAADELFACRPWDLAQDGHVLGIEAPEFGWPKGACAAFIGEVGESPSLMVFPSLDLYVGFLEQTDEAERTDEPPVVDCAVFSINFDPKREAPRDDVRRAKALGLKAADPQGFPWIERFAPRNIALDPEDEDYGFATGLMQATARLLAAHPDLLHREELPEALVTEGAFESEGKRHTVGLTVPHPEAPWRWDESALDYFRWATVDELYEDYLKSTEPAEGRECAEADVIGAAVEGFFAFKIFSQGLDPLDLAHDDLEEYLLRYLPGVDLPENEVQAIPGHLAAFVRWLGDEGRIDPELAAILAADTDRCRDNFLARMKKPKDGEAREGDAPEPAKKWVWQPGDPPPDPKGDCPCGSGKRYKRCCMPR